MEDTLEDFINKYKGTFVFVNQGGKELLCKFKETRDNQLLFEHPDYGNIILRFENAYENLKTKFPEKGLYNVGDLGFSMFFRVPVKQFKRSPCSGNAGLIRVFDNHLLQINQETINECFFPHYPKTKTDAIKSVNTRGGVALSRNIGITVSDVADFDVWFMNTEVGSIKGDKISVEYPFLKQEVIDFFGEDLTWK